MGDGRMGTQRARHRRCGLSALVSVVAVACGQGSGDDASVAVGVVADTYAVTSERRLIAFERATGETASVFELTGLAADDEILGADLRPFDDGIYVLTRRGKVYAVNPDRGALLVMSDLEADPSDTSAPFDGLTGEAFAIDFDPVADRLRVISDAGQNLRVDVDTGATITDAPSGMGSARLAAASYSNAFAAACRTQLYVIDPTTRTLFLQDPPNEGALSALAEVPAPAGAPAAIAFEIVMDDEGRGGALVAWPSAQGADLFDLDVRSGAVSNGRRLRLSQGEAVLALSARAPAVPPRQARGEMLGVTASNQLVSFNPGAPGKLCTRDPITGLADGEEVLGIDVRPADGGLYALGSSGRVYAVDAATAEATPRSALAADPSDVTAPFTGLPGGAYALAFNPVPDRLRVVSRDGLNLRIDVDTGATITDAPLSPASRVVPALAYTNAYAGATDTTLFAIDAGRGQLARIGGDPATAGACPDDTGNPNCGQVSEVGPLGLGGMSDVGGFEIDPEPAASSGWLALTLGEALGSSLYTVDLTTGTVSLPPEVADPGIGNNDRLRALTLATAPAPRAAP